MNRASPIKGNQMVFNAQMKMKDIQLAIKIMIKFTNPLVRKIICSSLAQGVKEAVVVEEKASLRDHYRMGRMREEVLPKCRHLLLPQ